MDPHKDPLISALACVHLAWWIAEVIDALLRWVLGIVL